MVNYSPERMFLRNLYKEIDRDRKGFNEMLETNKTLWEHDAGPHATDIIRLATSRLLLYQHKLVEFAKKKGWITKGETELAKLYLFEGGKCSKCS